MEQPIKEVRVEHAQQLGLTPDEFTSISEVMGRVPNFTELCVYSVMWSEHCSYKNSILWLKKLPKEGPHLLVKAGEENAGLVDIGDGMACAFKIESHNHPSAIEPYQGAATGVGGINRDIFTMGARPIAQLNSLRFGEITEDRTKWLIKGVVKGIGDYGNSFGIPVVGGEVYFDACYSENPLVNAMSAGVMQTDRLIKALAKGPGNPVYIVGSFTGKDGIGGASFASKDMTEDSAEDLPAVQVGDPFQEKLLLEATMELAETDAIIGMQDMGAAGIACSTSEMSAAGGVGMDIHLDRVPTRQSDMHPWELLLSESQERMLVVVKKGREEEVEKIIEKWDIHCAHIGEVTEGPLLRYYMNGVLMAEIPAESLVLGGGAPQYEREYREPAYFEEYKKFHIDQVKEPDHMREVALMLASSPNICSRRWVYEQYDRTVGTSNATFNNPLDAGISIIKENNKALAFTVDCNSRYVHADPETGTAIAVAEAARNIVCSGGKPSAITNCLNFGNPYNPEAYWQFVGAIKGMSKACEKFQTPVTGGNVSFYNQTSTGGKTVPVYPTPTIGMMGIIEDLAHITPMSFQSKGHLIYLIGESKNDINQSEYLRIFHGIEASPAPYFNLDEEYQRQRALMELIEKKTVKSAHDVSEGGLFIALLEMSLQHNLGFDILSDSDVRLDAFLFGESQGRMIVSVEQEKEDDFITILMNHSVPFTLLGHVTQGKMVVDDEHYGFTNEWKEVYDNALGQYIEKSKGSQA